MSGAISNGKGDGAGLVPRLGKGHQPTPETLRDKRKGPGAVNAQAFEELDKGSVNALEAWKRGIAIT